MARRTLGLRKNPREEERRAAIIHAAINVFSSKGYDDSTMDDIAAASGCSKGLIYWYWKDKPALYAELIDKCFAIYTDFISQTIQLDVPYGKKLNQFFWDLTELLKTNDPFKRLVHFGSLHHPKGKGQDFGNQVNKGFDILMTLLQEFLQQGVDSGYLRKNLDVEAVAFQLLCSYEGYLYMSMLQDRMPMERAFTNLWLERVIPTIVTKAEESL